MKCSMPALCLLGACFGSLWISPSKAQACSPPACWQSYLSPGDGASVPANLPAINWRPSLGFNEEADPTRVQLVHSGETVALIETQLDNGDLLFVFDEPLIEGESYQLSDSTTCSESWEFVSPENHFVVAAAAPLPTTLGTLHTANNGVGPLVVATGRGSCDITIDAHQIAVEVELSEEALAWRDALHFRTLVDGRPWGASNSINNTHAPGESWMGRGRDTVYLSCGDDSDGTGVGLTEGTHQIVIEASLPGSDLLIASDPVSVELSCGALGNDGESDAGSVGACSVTRRGSWPSLAVLLLLVLPVVRKRRGG